MRFREVLILKRRETISIVVAFIFIFGANWWGMYTVFEKGSVDAEVASSAISTATKFIWIGVPFLLFGLGSWLYRFNQWVMQAKES